MRNAPMPSLSTGNAACLCIKMVKKIRKAGWRKSKYESTKMDATPGSQNHQLQNKLEAGYHACFPDNHQIAAHHIAPYENQKRGKSHAFIILTMLRTQWCIDNSIASTEQINITDKFTQPNSAKSKIDIWQETRHMLIMKSQQTLLHSQQSINI